MSLTLAALINEILPKVKITIIERLDDCGKESSDGLNNAGTGHAGYCELNYTPQKNNNISIERAIHINEMFEISLQFWAYLDKKYPDFKVSSFLRKTPHISFVYGKENVNFLKKRYDLLKKELLFKDMQFTNKIETILQWAPLLIDKRKDNKYLAATKIDYGTDVNFGNLTRQLLTILKKSSNFSIHTNTEVKRITKITKKNWAITIQNKLSKKKQKLKPNKIFLGAGGQAISLLQQMNLNEAKGYAGFPISGKWLVCNNPKIVCKHNSKVYGQALPKAPPTSIPHLDLRVIDGKKTLMFGPFAGFTLKFLKYGSFLDFPKTIKPNNIRTMFVVLIKNINLLLYLIKQSLYFHKNRMQQLKNFFPAASEKDWILLDAGQRVQIMKNCAQEGIKLQFGTEIIHTKDKTVSALIGASPGASIAVDSMLDVINEIFEHELQDEIKKIIPSYGIKLNKNPKKLKEIRTQIYSKLKLL
jgi:malate dehydrogenase (quinone)